MTKFYVSPSTDQNNYNKNITVTYQKLLTPLVLIFIVGCKSNTLSVYLFRLVEIIHELHQYYFSIKY